MLVPKKKEKIQIFGFYILTWGMWFCDVKFSMLMISK